MDIFEEVIKLNLPKGEYAVASSGVLMAHGLREARDIDLLVTPWLYKKLQEQGWEVKKLSDGLEAVSKGIVEASPSICTISEHKPDILKLLEEAQIIKGVPFLTLESVKEFKKALGREKDKKDIELIDSYLNK